MLKSSVLLSAALAVLLLFSSHGATSATEGAATFVTGGRTVEPTTSAPGETRGREIDGGDAHQLSKGDVIVIPAGVPHWFKTVQTPFNDLIVKVRQENR